MRQLTLSPGSTLSSLHSIHPSGDNSFLLLQIVELPQYFIWLPSSSITCSQFPNLEETRFLLFAVAQVGFYFSEWLLTDKALGTRNGSIQLRPNMQL